MRTSFICIYKYLRKKRYVFAKMENIVKHKIIFFVLSIILIITSFILDNKFIRQLIPSNINGAE